MKKFKCELCEDLWKEDTDTDVVSGHKEDIREHGRCTNCFEEYGENLYPDQ